MVRNQAVAAARQDAALLKRFAGKIFIDVLPAALTSLLGSALIAQYQGHIIAAPQPVAQQTAAASPETLRLVRDEHAAIMNYLDAQAAAQKSRDAAEDAAIAAARARARALDVAEAELQTAVEPAAAAPQLAAAKPARHIKVAQAAQPALPPPAPLVVAQAAPDPVAPPPASAGPQSRSLLDKTLDLKDHVVAATGNAARSVVSAITGLPSFIAGIGDRKDVANLTSS